MRENRPKVALVWLKRDLRWEDHEPISKAIDSGYPVILWYNFEPILLSDKHYSARHWHFISESLKDFDRVFELKITLPQVGVHSRSRRCRRSENR